MPPRKPSDPQIRALIVAVESGGWSVTPPVGNSNIWKALCPCGEHLEHIHQTPGRNYARNKFNHMKNTCWKEAKNGAL